MKDNRNDRTIERNYIQKRRFLIAERQLVKAKSAPSSSSSRTSTPSTALGARPSPSAATATASPATPTPSFPPSAACAGSPAGLLPFIEQLVLDQRRKGVNRYETYAILFPKLGARAPKPSAIRYCCLLAVGEFAANCARLREVMQGLMQGERTPRTRRERVLRTARRRRPPEQRTLLEARMSAIGQVIKDALDRNERYMLAALEGLSPDELRRRPAPESNPVGWLMWHLSRVQDFAVNSITGAETVWVREGWHQRFGMAPEPGYRGNGDSNEQVDAFVPPDAETLAAYYKAVRANTDAFLDGLADADLDRLVPPVRGTDLVPLRERLPGIIVESVHHGGQVAYARGALQGRGWLDV